MASHFLRRPWPKIRAPLGRKPIQVKDWSFAEIPNRKRIEKLRSIVFNLVQQERLVVSHYQAFEVRPYMDRLIQMAIEVENAGACDEDASDIFRFWLMEDQNIDKLFKHLVPRFQKYSGVSYTRMFWLPDKKSEKYQPQTNEYGVMFHRKAIVELKGNPYPPVLNKPPSNSESLLNVLLKEAKRANIHQLLKDNAQKIDRATLIENEAPICNSESKEKL